MENDALENPEFAELLDRYCYATGGNDPGTGTKQRDEIQEYIRRAFVVGYDPLNVRRPDPLDSDPFEQLLIDYGTYRDYELNVNPGWARDAGEALKLMKKFIRERSAALTGGPNDRPYQS